MLRDRFLALKSILEGGSESSWRSSMLGRYNIKSLINALCEAGYSVSRCQADRVELICKPITENAQSIVRRTESELWRWGKRNGMLAGKPMTADKGLLVGRSYSAPVVEFSHISNEGENHVLTASIFFPDTYQGRLSVDSLRSRGKNLQSDL